MKILVAPLDWGLGHATRCIPVITELINQGDDVMIAASGSTEQLLKLEFPLLKYISLKGYNIRYSSLVPMALSMFLQLPKIIAGIFREHRELKKIIPDHHIDAIISDNRYGLWNNKIHSVFMTHQIMIKCPSGLKLFEPLLYRLNKWMIDKYDECWIPDDDKKISGDLSHRYPLPSNAKFIGLLSRWNGAKKNEQKKKYDIVGIVSGPEPARSSFEQVLISQLAGSNYKSLVVLGKPGVHDEKKVNENLSVVSHLEGQKLLEEISCAEFVICRPGYSSIMDLIALQKNVIFIPTPGQTEQEYLAASLKKQNKFFSVREKKFRLDESLHEAKKYSQGILTEPNHHLAKFLSDWKSSMRVDHNLRSSN